MRNKIYLAVICAIFFFFLVWCPSVSALEKLGAISLEDNKNYISPDIVYEAGFPFADLLNGIEKTKASIEDIYTNYLPAYDRIVGAIRSAESSLQLGFVDMLSQRRQKKEPEIPENAAMQGDEGDEAAPEETEPQMPQFSAVYVGEEGTRRFYAIRPYDFMESVMKMDEKNLYKNMKTQARGINKLIQANTDVNFYLYIGKTMQDTKYFNEIIPNELCTAPMFDEFMESIEGAAGIGYFQIDTWEDRLAKQFKTDHHWNAAGSYDAYCDIIQMMAEKTPEIGEPVRIKEIKEYPKIKMRGSYANLSGFSNFYEEFFVHVYDFQNESTARYSMASREAEYDAGVFDNPDNILFDHYSNFYIDKRKYIYENNNGRNLMIIADSLSWWSAWLIAGNFEITYVYFPWDYQEIDYNGYIEKNNITDVLMLVYSQAGIFNVYGYCNYGQLK